MTTTSSSAAAVVARYFDAFGHGDIATARGLLWDNLSFKGPLDTFDNAPLVKSLEQQGVLVDGDDVATFYDLVTPVGTAPVAEWHHVRDGKIDRIQVYFDPRAFAQP